MTITSPDTMDTKLGRISLELDAPVARIVLRHPPLNIIDIAMMEELAQSLAEIESRPEVSVIVDYRRWQSILGRSGCGGAHSRHSAGDVGQVSRGDSSAGRDEESHGCRGAWALSWRWSGIGHGVRHGLHHRIGSNGDFQKLSWAAIRRWRARRWPRLWDRSARRN